MLVCGIIDELSQSTSSTTLLTYFFCEATNSQINTATAVLRGLIYMLILQQPSLALHVRRKYDHAGKAIFEDSDAWFALLGMFTDIIQDPYLVKAYLIIDALDECVASDLPRLLNFIVEKSSLSSRVKWIVTSRNWPLIEERMEMVENRENLRLELNAESVSAAVDIFIRYKVQQLGRSRKYSSETQDAILNHLASNADSTFLWVSLVCENLKSTPQVTVRARLKLFPPGLHSLYSRMMVQIAESEEPSLCKRILAIVSTVYRPLSLAELALIVDMSEEPIDDVTSFSEVIGLCGSFIVVRDRMVNFVHQSAKDYLLEKRYGEIFPTGIRDVHCTVFLRSISVLSITLRRNIYNLNEHGYPVNEIQIPDPDPLEGARYACLHWIDHFVQLDLDDAMLDDVVEMSRSLLMAFLIKNYLYWLEAVSICRGIFQVVFVIVKLDNIIQVRGDPMLSKLVHDIRRHIFTYKHIIALAPLQTYVSSLIFSPRNSLIKHYFNDLQPSWITIRPSVMPHLGHWDQCLQSLEGHLRVVYSATFSTDGKRIASASFDDTIRIWDATSGECERILNNCKSFESAGYMAVFLHDSDSLASASSNDICVWQISRGECVKTLQGHHAPVSSLAFSLVLGQLASGSCDGTIRLWDVAKGSCLRTMESGVYSPQGVAFSSDSAWLLSQCQTSGVKFGIWDVRNMAWISLEGHDMVDNKVAISHDLTQIASSSLERVRIWHVPTGSFKQSFNCSAPVGSMVYLHQPTRLALSFLIGTAAEIWDTSNGSCLQRLTGHSAYIYALAFSQKSLQLLTASSDSTIRLWDVCGDFGDLVNDENRNFVEVIVVSPNSQMIASRSADVIKIWDTDSDESIHTVLCPPKDAHSLRFSVDSNRLLVYRWPLWPPSMIKLLTISVSRGNDPMELSNASVDVDDLPHEEIDHGKNALWIGVEKQWINYKLTHLVWLPPSFRPSKCKVHGQTMVFSTVAGKLWWCKIDFDNIKL